jgi:multidrug efflux pump subunit AcrA (membrane-fusion protein)
MRRLAWVVAGVVVVAGTGFAVVTAAGADEGGRYRTATVASGDVSQTVSVSGTVDHVNRFDGSFGTDGTVATLPAVGATVSEGQELGTLDTAAPQAAVDKAQAELTDAETALSEASSAAEEAASSDASDDSSDASSGDDSGEDSSAAAEVVQAVKDAQSAASSALKAASDAVTAQAAACVDPASTACAAAGSATLAAQQAVQTAQDTLQTKLDALSAALSAQSQTAESSESSESEDSRAGPSDSSASASSVAEAQAAVDEASVKLLEAQQALAGAKLTSPITGTVALVASAVGEQVSAGDSVVVVIGEGAAEVSATVPVEKVGDLAVGQEAEVTPAGLSSPVKGTVTRVGTIPDANADSVAYPVTITVDKPPATMAAGSSATAAIVVATAEDVLTVPTSAVNRGTVTVLSGDQTTVTRVTVGAVGPTRTEITEGLSAGDQVVLANLDSPLPTSDQSTNTGPGGFTDGGGPPGGGMMRVRPGN